MLETMTGLAIDVLVLILIGNRFGTDNIGGLYSGDRGWHPSSPG